MATDRRCEPSNCTTKPDELSQDPLSQPKSRRPTPEEPVNRLTQPPNVKDTRDRCLQMRHPTVIPRGTFRPSRVTAGIRTWTRRVLAPVSYTHLTLPTKR